MLPSRHWIELTTSDLAQADMRAQIAVLPVAAIEQHGPHLPLGTDAYIMEGYLARVHERLPADLPALFLPMQTIGVSLEHSEFPGTLHHAATTIMTAWSDLLAAVAATGVRKLVIVNSHGGNSSVVEILSREVRARHGVFVGLASWQRFGYPDGLFDDDERLHGIHGGEIETSLMLCFRPDLVRRTKARNFVPASVAMERDFTWLRPGRPTGYAWMAQDLLDAGVAGDAAAATAEKGEACADYGATAFIEFLRDVEAFDLDALGPAPGR